MNLLFPLDIIVLSENQASISDFTKSSPNAIIKYHFWTFEKLNEVYDAFHKRDKKVSPATFFEKHLEEKKLFAVIYCTKNIETLLHPNSEFIKLISFTKSGLPNAFFLASVSEGETLAKPVNKNQSTILDLFLLTMTQKTILKMSAIEWNSLYNKFEHGKKLIDENRRLIKKNKRLTNLSITDELTGLANMRYFKKRLKQEFSRSQRYNRFLSVIMLDLDFFKNINDQHDHLGGSHMIRQVGILIGKAIRADDLGARFGGDEYVLMLPETTSFGAYNLAQRLLNILHAKEFSYRGHQLKVTASFGHSTFDPNLANFDNWEEFLRSSDLNLYKAKNLGRAQVYPFEEEI